MEEKQALVEQYFANELTLEERVAFEKQLEEDPELARLFHLELDILTGIDAYGDGRLRARLKEIHYEVVTKPARAKKMRALRRFYALAAALLLGLIALAWWVFGPKPVTPERLYAEYAVYSFAFTEKGEGERLLYQAEAYWDKKDYANALPLLEQYLLSNKEASGIKLAAGVAKVELGQDYAGAFNLFHDVESKGGLLANEAEWHMALAYLKQEQLDQCLNALSKIPASSSRYGQAKSLQEAVIKLQEK